ncbi:DUF2334 domain-containing protein [Methanococcus voltae]|uniref:Deacetylase-like protein n=1 Tax=Methanococcus voltae (strain ATCC BAA-1334 / A3) TaxID=456320 RepID=D7DSJ1_METV3|nr:DUF2334 domain-containing protein [Methanococcus voltae]MCS3902002.1 putative deacetylase [Methanococcus voltae]
MKSVKKSKLSSKYSTLLLLIVLVLVLLVSTMFFADYHGKYLKYDPLKDVSNDRCYYNASTPIVLIHDVSPKYIDEMKEITEILDNNHYSTRTYLFVIVNHANENKLTDYPEFVEYLHELDKKGYHIQYHGYDHIAGEYNCNESVAKQKLNESIKILNNCQFDTNTINYVITPRYKLSKDSANVFLNRNFTIIMDYYILKNRTDGIEKIIITNKEYTWYMPENCTEIAKNVSIVDYKNSLKENNQFTLSIHPKAVNYGNGIEFLDYFLRKTNYDTLKDILSGEYNSKEINENKK